MTAKKAVAHRGGTYLATFREVTKAYPCVPREEILRDLIRQSPGDEGKWFTAAKELGLYDLVLELVRDSPCNPVIAGPRESFGMHVCYRRPHLALTTSC